MSTISFGKVINQILNTTQINTLIQGRVYPLAAPNFDKYPFVIYQRNDINEEKNKDIKIWDIVDYEILVCSDSYENSVEVAEVIRAEMNVKNLVVNEFNIYNIEFVTSKEGIINPKDTPLFIFTQSLIYRFRVRN